MPVHDPGSNMTRGPRPGAESTATEGLLMVWDGWNRMVKVFKDNGTGAGNAGVLVVTPGQGQTADTLLAEYQYDGRGFRIVKLVPNGENWGRSDWHCGAGWSCLAGKAPRFTASRRP